MDIPCAELSDRGKLITGLNRKPASFYLRRNLVKYIDALM